ncbi:MAG: transglutaminase family protein, partial [Planctomycetota bacterium]
IDPEPNAVSHAVDYYGNPVAFFSIDRRYTGLSVRASSELHVDRGDVVAQLGPGGRWEEVRNRLATDRTPAWLDAHQFLFDSPLVVASADFRDFAATSFEPGRPVVEAARDLMSRVHEEFTYDINATNVATAATEAFGLRAGVCQDFAHVMIAMLRSLGLPARYVSGYVRSIPAPGRPRMIGAAASHAWVSVFCGDAGWLDLDPTNDVPINEDHVVIGWGRDYGDVPPVRGLFVGGGDHSLSVSVDVAPLDLEQPVGRSLPFAATPAG